MSKLEELIQKYCPDGVEWKPLSELGDFYSGLTGKTKEDFRDGNAKFITYVNIFNNPSLKTDVEEKVKIAPGEKQNTIQYGDALFTGSSETPDECGMCSVLTHQTDEKLYLNSFCFGFRFFDLSDKCPSFMKHLFRSTSIRKAICRTANGVTRFNVSKKEFAKIEIPIPPLPVQEEIVRVLDTFTELQAELQAELQKRLQQYNYYRDNLLSFDGRTDVEWKKLGEMCSVLRGKRLTKSQLSPDGRYKVFHGGIEPIGYYGECNREANTTMVINVGASAGTIGFSKDMFWSSDGCFCLSQTPLLSSRYLYYYLQTKEPYLMSRVRRAGIPTLDGKVLEDLLIPTPTLEEQQKIVDILDRFDALTTDLTAGLPAEIEKRRQQYEFYRDKLLTFNRKEA